MRKLKKRPTFRGFIVKLIILVLVLIACIYLEYYALMNDNLQLFGAIHIPMFVDIFLIVLAVKVYKYDITR